MRKKCILLFLSTLFTFIVPLVAYADVIPPEVEACSYDTFSGKNTGHCFIGYRNGIGQCVPSTCVKRDYNPKYCDGGYGGNCYAEVEYQCLRCLDKNGEVPSDMFDRNDRCTPTMGDTTEGDQCKMTGSEDDGTCQKTVCKVFDRYVAEVGFSGFDCLDCASANGPDNGTDKSSLGGCSFVEEPGFAGNAGAFLLALSFSLLFLIRRKRNGG
ncbi:MAG: hypothetical protein WC889_15275 [Myxococcota bacterium]|jgi:hypothetical protein